jgi:O-antigen ligase
MEAEVRWGWPWPAPRAVARRAPAAATVASPPGWLAWAGLLGATTASVVLFGAVDERHLAPIELALFALLGAVVLRRWRAGAAPLAVHPAAVPLLALAGLAALQLLPLPASVTVALSPGLAGLRDGLPMAAPPATLALSAYSYATHLALLELAAYAAFFLLALEAIATPVRVRAVLRSAAVLGTTVAGYGIVSYLLGNTYLLWLPRRFYLDSVTGTFVNHNHFAALMVLLIPALLAYYWLPLEQAPVGRHGRGEAAARAAFFLVCGALMGLALLLSTSRGGVASAAAALGGLALVARRRGGAGGRRAALLLAALGGLVLVWGALVGLDPVIERFLRVADEGGEDSRVWLWSDSLRIVRDFPLLGSGLGTYAHVFPAYKTSRAQLGFSHAHNDYLELLTDGGVVALALGLWGALRCARRLAAVRPATHGRAALVVWALAAGAAGMLLHSAVDFGLRIPANAFCLLLLGATALRIAEDPGLVDPAAGARRGRIGGAR